MFNFYAKELRIDLYLSKHSQKELYTLLAKLLKGIKKEVKIRYYYFLFEPKPDIFLLINTDRIKKVKEIVSPILQNSLIVYRFGYAIGKSNKNVEHKFFNQIMTLFTDFAFQKVLHNKFQTYNHFSEQKIFHCILNQTLKKWSKETNFYLTRLSQMYKTYLKRDMEWRTRRW